MTDRDSSEVRVDSVLLSLCPLGLNIGVGVVQWWWWRRRRRQKGKLAQIVAK